LPSKGSRKGGTLGIAEAMKGYLSRAGLKSRMEQTGVIEEWDRLVGAQIARVTVPERITREGTLYVRVASAAWMQELQLMTPTILAQLRQRTNAIKEIRYHC
jgi:predicted nucleic acid-binding Zn ribbon protein